MKQHCLIHLIPDKWQFRYHISMVTCNCKHAWSHIVLYIQPYIHLYKLVRQFPLPPYTRSWAGVLGLCQLRIGVYWPLIFSKGPLSYMATSIKIRHTKHYKSWTFVKIASLARYMLTIGIIANSWVYIVHAFITRSATLMESITLQCSSRWNLTSFLALSFIMLMFTTKTDWCFTE